MSKNNFDFISASGEMADLVRSTDWQNSLVGIPENWPQSLRTTLSNLLNSNFPMFLFWGKELVCFYNDAYRPSLGITGKHPSLLGSTAKVGWSEVYEHVLEWTNHIFDTGEPLMFHDNLVPFYRNGKMEDIYWTFSYSAVVNDFGEIGGVLVTCMETTTQVESLHKLEKSKAELQFAIESAELGTFDYDPKTEMFSSNKRFRDWYGLDNKPWHHLSEGIRAIHPADIEMFSAALADAIDPEKRQPFDIEFTAVNFITKNEVIVRAKGKAEFSPEQQIALSLNGTVQDITEQRKFTEELEKQIQVRTQKLDEVNTELAAKNRTLERRNKELRSFSYISSHDLQEPLRKIQTFASRIVEKEYDNLSEKGRNYFDRMRASANRMQALIQDLLSYSKIDNNHGEVAVTPINELLNEVISELREEIEEKNATVTITGFSEITLVHFQFFQLFYNLLTNSFKFARQGVSPEISIHSEIIVINHSDDFFENGKSYCRIIFKDNGIGFEAAQNQRIFELFQRLHGKSQFEGTGIGLAIVKKIIENHKGKIEALGVPDEGATFVIHLPA